MIDILLWISFGLWTLMLIQMTLFRLSTPNLARRPVRERNSWPSVSIVVPARNEEAEIERAVTSFCTQDYPNIEVVVVNDGSTDSTPVILERLIAQHSNLTVVTGVEPPEGWLGKVWALEQGRRQARGDWMLFVDADVEYHSELVRRAISLLLDEERQMLVLAPKFRDTGPLLASVLGHLFLVGGGLIPAWLINHSRSRFLATGAGTFNLVRRDAVEACGAFASIRDMVIDDVGLGYKVKSAGFRQMLARSRDLISLRMYDGVRDAVHGFTKNVAPGLGGVNPLMLPVLLFLGFGLSLLPYLAFVWGLAHGQIVVSASAALVMMHAVHAFVANEFHLPWQVAFLSPYRELVWWWIVIRSTMHYRRYGLVWRGRRYPS
ncbi:MAG: glycosyltransferase [bacterium]|nr:glycosyltransferase [bacterium]